MRSEAVRSRSHAAKLRRPQLPFVRKSFASRPRKRLPPCLWGDSNAANWRASRRRRSGVPSARSSVLPTLRIRSSNSRRRERRWRDVARWQATLTRRARTRPGSKPRFVRRVSRPPDPAHSPLRARRRIWGRRSLRRPRRRFRAARNRQSKPFLRATTRTRTRSLELSSVPRRTAGHRSTFPRRSEPSAVRRAWQGPRSRRLLSSPDLRHVGALRRCSRSASRCRRRSVRRLRAALRLRRALTSPDGPRIRRVERLLRVSCRPSRRQKVDARIRRLGRPSRRQSSAPRVALWKRHSRCKTHRSLRLP